MNVPTLENLSKRIADLEAEVRSLRKPAADRVWVRRAAAVGVDRRSGVGTPAPDERVAGVGRSPDAEGPPVSEPVRHPDLLSSEEAAAYMGVARLDQLPDEFKPKPLPYNSRLYHRGTLDEIVNRAAAQSAGAKTLRRAS